MSVRDVGRQRLYQLNGHALEPIHHWVDGVRVLWEQRFEQLDSMLAELTEQERSDESDK